MINVIVSTESLKENQNMKPTKVSDRVLPSDTIFEQDLSKNSLPMLKLPTKKANYDPRGFAMDFVTLC